MWNNTLLSYPHVFVCCHNFDCKSVESNILIFFEKYFEISGMYIVKALINMPKFLHCKVKDNIEDNSCEQGGVCNI